MSVLLADPAVAGSSCADRIGADRVQAAMAAASNEVFIVIFPYLVEDNHVAVAGD
jgi:hypothetical protein